MPRDWDATAYERLSAPLEAMGRDVLRAARPRRRRDGARRGLRDRAGDGCAGRAPAARARDRGRRLAGDGRGGPRRLPRCVDVREADLLELALAEPVDAIVSTATFHWIGDHDRLFARLRDALKPGGRLVAQCGGAGNVAASRTRARGGAREPRTRSTWRVAGRLELRVAGGHRAAAARCRLHRRLVLALARRRDRWTTRRATSRRSASARSSSGCRRSSTTASWTPPSNGSARRCRSTTSG